MTSQITPEQAREVLAETPASWWDSPYARALETLADMKTEWGVEDRWGEVVWFIPTDYVGVDDEESKRMAEEYAAGDDDYYLVRRYVTETINDV